MRSGSIGTIAKCLSDIDEELILDSKSNRRVIATYRCYISYGAQHLCACATDWNRLICLKQERVVDREGGGDDGRDVYSDCMSCSCAGDVTKDEELWKVGQSEGHFERVGGELSGSASSPRAERSGGPGKCNGTDKNHESPDLCTDETKDPRAEAPELESIAASSMPFLDAKGAMSLPLCSCRRRESPLTVAFYDRVKGEYSV
ncbi:Hypothetical predicted protein [Olea europaea subsp. europaea]|uniref:Uncharacterized protein n=1 Tax=Olea europaea subsp. europaea TaxID=158383 RepID=A0A8S0Q5F8_OLEEU|nr:Hypothetical predicted protein [Olea europaea subsp. europaea]